MHDLYKVPDTLRGLRDWFKPIADRPRVLERLEAETLIELLDRLADQALLHVHEISRHRWNALAATDLAEHEREMAEQERLMLEAMRPGSNLVLVNFGHSIGGGGVHGA